MNVKNLDQTMMLGPGILSAAWLLLLFHVAGSEQTHHVVHLAKCTPQKKNLAK